MLVDTSLQPFPHCSTQPPICVNFQECNIWDYHPMINLLQSARELQVLGRTAHKHPPWAEYSVLISWEKQMKNKKVSHWAGPDAS